MHRGYVAVFLLGACQAFAWAGPSGATAEKAASTPSMDKPADERPTHADLVVDRIRSKLADPGLHSTADPADLAALEAFYGHSGAAPLWVTDMGLSSRAQSALFEIEKANDWGLDAAAF